MVAHARIRVGGHGVANAHRPDIAAPEAAAAALHWVGTRRVEEEVTLPSGRSGGRRATRRVGIAVDVEQVVAWQGRLEGWCRHGDWDGVISRGEESSKTGRRGFVGWEGRGGVREEQWMSVMVRDGRAENIPGFPGLADWVEVGNV